MPFDRKMHYNQANAHNEHQQEHEGKQTEGGESNS